MIFDLHERALEASRRYRRAQSDLVPIIQEVESTALFYKRGHTSLFKYCVNELRLSENCTLNFIAVARKSTEVPALLTAILNQEISISKARKITPVIARDPEYWLELARTSSSRRIEEEVAKVAPREAVRERLQPVSENIWNLQTPVSREIQEKLRRVQDLESQRTGRAVSIEEALDALLDLYLNTKDPIKRANRVLKKLPHRADSEVNPSPEHVPGHVVQYSQQAKIDALTQHKVRIRDEGRCTHIDENGQRCESRRWLDVHHIQPRSEGGDNRIENLALLCGAHHRLEHQSQVG